MTTELKFPIDMSEYKHVTLNLSRKELTREELEQIQLNVQLARDAIVFYTALAGAKGLGGHTGGAYDITPEVIIADSLVKDKKNNIFPILFDEAGHRVAIQYLMSALNDNMPLEKLLEYREPNGGLPGHPERGYTPGILFSGGRLGHTWGFANGIARANPGKTIIMIGSDGSQEEGNDAEAARKCVAQNLNVKLFLDDNDVTIAGHPKDYMPGYDLEKTLSGHGVSTRVCKTPEDVAKLYSAMQSVLIKEGPQALINRRKMAPGIPGIEGTPKGHDVVSLDAAVEYLTARGQTAAVDMLQSAKKRKSTTVYLGSTTETGKNRDDFGKIVNGMIDNIPAKQRASRIVVVDSDLEGSCGLHHIKKAHPEVYVSGGIMERDNYLFAAGFGSEEGKQGVFGTFAAFLEMVVSEITMARLNDANVLAHFSHSGVDDMADNTCHFGISNFMADNGISDGDTTRLYFPADPHQMKAVVETIFNDPGLRFIFSTRSAVPYILDQKGKQFFNPANGYEFVPGKDEVIRPGKDGYVVAYGEMLYRALTAVENLRTSGIDVGLINKPTLNVVDEETMKLVGKSPFVLVVESQNYKNGLGSRFGTQLLERGFHPKYQRLGVTKHGISGLGEQIDHQGLDPNNIAKVARQLYANKS